MIKNPRTNRLMKIGSQMHRKAVKDGLLPGSTLGPIEEPTPTKHIEMTDDPVMTEVEPEIIQKPIKKPIQKPIEEPEPIKRLMKQLAIQPEEYTPEEPKPVKRTIKKPEIIELVTISVSDPWIFSSKYNPSKFRCLEPYFLASNSF